MKVYLQYFRESGKWYTDDEYETSVKDLMVMIGHAPKPYVRLNSYEV